MATKVTFRLYGRKSRDNSAEALHNTRNTRCIRRLTTLYHLVLMVVDHFVAYMEFSKELWIAAMAGSEY